MNKGQKFTNRNGTEFTIGTIKDKNFEVIKASGKSEKISFKKVNEVKAGLLEGKSYKFQANKPQGGISYTIAIEAGVIAWIDNNDFPVIADNETRTYHK